jgi:hypothetical protein
MNAKEPAIRDRSCVRDREAPGALPPAQHSVNAIPGDPGAQLGEFLRGIAAREHVEHVLELVPRKLTERIGARD